MPTSASTAVPSGGPPSWPRPACCHGYGGSHERRRVAAAGHRRPAPGPPAGADGARAPGAGGGAGPAGAGRPGGPLATDGGPRSDHRGRAVSDLPSHVVTVVVPVDLRQRDPADCAGWLAAQVRALLHDVIVGQVDVDLQRVGLLLGDP